jgi:hypothetical protein
MASTPSIAGSAGFVIIFAILIASAVAINIYLFYKVRRGDTLSRDDSFSIIFLDFLVLLFVVIIIAISVWMIFHTQGLERKKTRLR